MELGSLHGIFMDNCSLWIALSVLIVLVMGYLGLPLIVWALAVLAMAYFWGASVVVLGVLLAGFLLFLIKPLRAATMSNLVLTIFKKLGFLPKISETERVALDAGVTWVEKDLFSGKPDFKKLMNESYPDLTAEEKAFMQGPVEKLCEMIDAWKTWKSRDIEAQVWEYIKKERFLGMIIPKEYGGLGFSALAHSEVIMKLSSRSLPVTIQVMVPNSLGPAELLVHYGTKEQKDYYLPRLARGEEMPCFGLTEPLAGSDAGSISSSGELFRGPDGKLMIKLNWNKRWITLAAISSVIGLAFRLRDPQNLLGRGEDVGITCGLIPANTPGVVLGRRHDPLTIPFYNCPTQGKDVVVPLDAVVGGVEGCGKGWGMLTECLAAGRGISLPAQATGGSKLAARVCSAHGVVRKQFGFSIGQFEGIEEPMARIAASTYALEAMRRYTVGALDKGIKPSTITAMQKYYSTEMGRKVINDAMDIMGGAGISLGPRNLLGEMYVATPIGITVEGANIMTRTLIIFGQGAMRSHPYAYQEVKAVETNDLKLFDEAFWGHVGHIINNLFRSIVLSLTRGYVAGAPDAHPEMKIYFRRLQWASSTFAILADVAMGSLGGQLRAKQKITGRFADIMAYMFMATSVLRRFEAEGRQEDDLPLVHFNLKFFMSEIQKAFDGIFDNLKVPGLRWFIKGWIGAWSRINSIGSLASDGWSHHISDRLLYNEGVRNRLTEGIFIPRKETEQLARLEKARKVTIQADSAEKKIRKAIREKVLPKKKAHLLVDEALAKSVITAEEARLLKESDHIRYDAILVDDFSEQEYHS
ncbi:MAG: acyl-CoA dehydrogenase [Bdellovibrionales bacterium]